MLAASRIIRVCLCPPEVQYLDNCRCRSGRASVDLQLKIVSRQKTTHLGYPLISLKENIKKILPLLVNSPTVLRLRFGLEHRKLNFATGLFDDLIQTTFFLSTISYPEHEIIILTALKGKVLCER